MSDHRRDAGMALATALLAGTAGCTASPQYPINVGERPGDGSVIAVQPRYPVSASDAAQNAADRASQNGYPAYGSAPAAAPPGADAASPSAAPPPPADAQDDDAPKALPGSSVDSSDLPPPDAAPPPDAGTPPAAQPDAQSDAQPDAGPPPPRAISWGGGQIVFGTDSVDQPALEFAAYRHHRKAAAAKADDSPAAKTSSSSRRRHGHAAAAGTQTPAPATAQADTPYQTIVKPGEKLSAVAERVHSSPAALTALNGLKHPRRVKAGTVLKIPYRYTYEVQKGDTLYTISKRFDQAPEAVAKLNGLKAVPTLQPGEALALPPTAADQGKRDHATAAGPTPVAAPEKLADKALRKAVRRVRRGRVVETARAPAAEPAPTRRSIGPLAPVYAEASPAPSPAYEPPHATTEAATAPAAETARTAAVTLTPAVTAPSTVATASPPRTYAPAGGAAVAAPGAVQPTYAGVRPTPYRPPAAAPTPSTYTAPGYAAAGTASDTTRVASLTSPRATSSFATSGYVPTLGRERPAAPFVPGVALTPSEVAAAGRGRFIWPMQGKVISPFGDKGTGEHNDGVDIAANPGTTVRAAAAGEVVYAGDSIPGFGNLVLVKHPGGWVTAYAHLYRIECHMRDAVGQGQEIGEAGQTGAVDRSELHFEVRYAPDPTAKARPVDPVLVLPAG